MITGVAFDLDGTLWDATTSIWYSWGKYLNNPELPFDLVRGMMGQSAETIAEALEVPEEEFARMQKEELADLKVVEPRIYEGVQAVLYGLKSLGLQVYIVSSCQEGYIDEFIQQSGLPRYIFDGCFFDGYPYSNKTDNLRFIRDKLAGTVVYVGDTERDRNAAQAAKTPFIHATYGFGQGSWGDWVINDIRQLPNLLRKWGYLDV